MPGIGNPGTEIDAFCDDANDIAISGGFWTSHGDLRVASSYAVRPAFGIHRWHVGVLPFGAAGQAQASVDCLNVP